MTRTRTVLLATGALALAVVPALSAQARPMLGGPGLHGGFGHPGTAMSIHAPGGGNFHPDGGFKPIDGGGTRPGQGGGGERHPPGPGPGPHPGPPGPGPGPGPHPGPGPGPGPHPPGPPPPPPGPYWWGWDDDWAWGAVAAGAVVGATVAAATIGTTVYVLPSDCPSVIRNGLTYYNCSGVWYQPSYVGSGVTYTVITAPPL